MPSLRGRPLLALERLRGATPSDTEYWARRAGELGARAVFNIEHGPDELGAVTAMQKRVLYPLREALDGSERTVLDFGCGTGRFTSDLAEMVGGRAIGLDPIPTLLELAPGHERVEYREMSPGRVPLRDGWADVTWVCVVLGGITDDEVLRDTAHELERVLRPGGLLFLVENTTERDAPRHWSLRTVSEYRELFAGVRLAAVGEYEDSGERLSVLAGRSHHSARS